MIVDSYRFLPRSFRPLYEGRGPLRGEDAPVWAPFEKRLGEARIALVSSAGIYLREAQQSFDVEGEEARPEWGDPSWRAIPAAAQPVDLAFAHLHISHDDLLTDPEIALPMHLLSKLAVEGVIGGTVAEHVSVMGYQERDLHAWKEVTAPALVSHLREQGADALVLAPA